MADGEDKATELGSLASVLRGLAAAPAELLVRGTRIDDQYDIERVLGHGAMGVVYLARDRRLERQVAIKVTRERSPTALARASREAVSLARLAHPNVVTVHQVGALDGRVYVAMEYVAETARTWCAEPTRTWRAILGLYLGVGDGLAAAHALGLVHRDFKPDNVLVGDDGRGRVADFGLATASGATTDGAAGTPAYMPPEQARGDAELDARADQFAFCVALREAFGDRAIPRHVEAALRRGAAAERDARWPAMAPLLAELRRDPARRRRVLGVSVGVPVLASGALIAVLVATRAGTPAAATPPADPCATGAARIAQTWPGSTRGAAAGQGPALDAWTVRWAKSYRTVCQAGWSSAMQDRGMACLAHDEHALAAALVALPTVEAMHAGDLVSAIPWPESCADAASLGALAPQPTDPAVAARVATANDLLAQVELFEMAAAIDRADAIVARVEAMHIEFAPLAARIRGTRGILLRYHEDDQGAVPLLEKAYFEGRAAGDRAVAARVAGELALAMLDLSRDAEAGRWAQLAEVELAGLGDPRLEATVDYAVSSVASARGDHAHAIALATRVVDIKRGIDTEWLGTSLIARANVFLAAGDAPHALADLDEAAMRVHTRYGAVHPQLAVIDTMRVQVFVLAERSDAAVAAGERAVAIAEKIEPLDGPTLDNARGALGVAYTHAHRFPEALALIDDSLARNRERSGDRSYNTASDRNNRCDLLTQMRRFADARAECTLALAIFTEISGADSSEVGAAEFNLANVELAANRLAPARIAAERALAILGKTPGDAATRARALRDQVNAAGGAR